MSSLQNITIKKAALTPCKGSNPPKQSLDKSGNRRAFRIEEGIVTVDYFEDILSPNVTAYIKLNTTAGAYSTIPIRGFERLDLVLGTNYGDLSFDGESKTPPLYVAAVRDLIQDETSESFTLVCKTKECFNNEISRCGNRFEIQSISTHVRTILTDVLKVDSSRINEIEESSTTYGFMGNMKKPFQVLVWLAPKASTSSQSKSGTEGKGKGSKARGTAGFFFWETRDGFNFKSIESLLSAKANSKSADNKEIPKYTATSVTDREATDRQIIHYFIDKNTDVQKNLRTGLYNNLQYFFDPVDWQLDAIQYELKEEKENLNTSADFIPLPGEGDERELIDYSSRIMCRIGDTGMWDPAFAESKNSEMSTQGRDKSDMCKSFSRYNLLFTQSLNIVIPINPNLKAGDIIYVELPKADGTVGNVKKADAQQSSLYLIRSVRHHFEISGGTNTTSLNLIRDSYGIE
tara:strand:+ start:490 stop:1872 length:1383 start_codon:yes stop_codon:yes gene_type:complete